MLLDATEEEIEETIMNAFNRDNGFAENLLYNGCKDALSEINFDQLEIQHVKGPVRVFLIHWGFMARVLNREGNDWEQILYESLMEISEELTLLQTQNLLTTNLETNEEVILHCYRSINNGLNSPVATSKVLHILFPEYFPMWDNPIRFKMSKEVREELDNIPFEIPFNNGIGASSMGFYKMMIVSKLFLNRNLNIFEFLEQNTTLSKLRLVDMFFFEKTR